MFTTYTRTLVTAGLANLTVQYLFYPML